MPLLIVSDLKINGITMPQPKIGGLKIKSEKIWSKNTGRSASTTMLGTILSIKRTVDISWPALSTEQVASIEAVVSNKDLPFVPMSYTDQTGNVHTMQVYFGTPTYSCFEWINGQWMVTDVSVSGIEQ